MEQSPRKQRRFQKRSLAIIAVAIATVSLFVFAARSPTPTRLDEIAQEVVAGAEISFKSTHPIETGPVIPGLNQNAIPQGIAFASAQDRILISHYSESGPSFISVTDNESDELIAAIGLRDSASAYHTGHSGGIAIVGDSLFVASDGQVLRYSLLPFVDSAPAEYVSPIARQLCETNADFATATSDTLFVGEFAYGRFHPTNNTHHCFDRCGKQKRAWVCGYEISSASDSVAAKPSFVFSIPDCIQGMYVTDDRIYLSESFGRRYRSRIFVFSNPQNTTAHGVARLSDATEVPHWFLDDENLLATFNLPPMAEGITFINERLAILTESGARKYRLFGTEPIDRILLMDISTTEK